MKHILGARFWHRLILERIHRLFVIIIGMQVIQVFSDDWWDETYSIIYGTMIVVAVVELSFTRGSIRRFLVGFVAALLFIFRNAPFEWYGWPSSWKKWDAIVDFVQVNAEQLHPFFEITVATLCAVHLLSWVGKSRAGAIFIIVSSILMMAVMDSFFPLELWKNIAWIVVTGLTWLVIIHLRQLQARHPDSWEALAERPLDLAIPAVFIIGLILFLGVIMPRAPVILEDPYTLWTEAQGIERVKFNGDGGETNPVNPKRSGSSLSGYSRDDTSLGGGFQFDYSPVMTITTSQRSYWRGESKAVYSGKGWNDNKGLGTLLNTKENTSLPLLPARAEGVETKEVVQTVNVLRKDKISVLFAAGPATEISAVQSDNQAKPLWNPIEWELRWSKPTRVESYTVISEVVVLDEDALRKQPHLESSSEIDLTPYLQLPNSLPERVRELANEQTTSATNDYDRGKLLEQFLQKNYLYTNEPDLSKQVSDDFVDAFLFEIQEGYCDYYSSAFVIMARTVGLPARWVKGYATGYDPVELERQRFGGFNGRSALDVTGAGTYTVRNADAHSWAEIYFEGYGWIPFEPTSGFSVPQPRVTASTTLPDQDIELSTDVDPTDAVNNNKLWIIVSGILGGVMVIASIGYIIFRKRGGFDRIWNRVRSRGNSADQRVVREMEKLIVFMNRRGLKRDQNETMRESFTRWSGRFSSLKSDFDGALTNFEHARYGQESGSDQRLHDFHKAANNIRKAL
ncbi:MAG: transglutaminaseTgpA domain-containing protein [Candidatus Cohnella colombiensis]|uniref:TransglutaminaseTgpA domain-containing protein n=1 Tax=Candidatus Cohnella colombiensis TaxID=3121368 RepID=A0AA95JEY4_9BACL|nr:MAG: transglutaminaseTgpA domain-containing protein [Cohnella sp.]